ncbi:MAG: gamma-glutamylcyclotransferase family protein [Polyangiales bacterium]
MSDDVVAYFAFGANTCRHVLVGRRRIEPLRSEPALLRDHALRFVRRGIPLLEPAFASVEPEPGATVHGVLHRLTPTAMAHLDRIEGRGYDRIAVQVETRDGSRIVATAYRARDPVPGLRPSRRYVELLIRGARENDLPEPWIEELARLETVHVPLVASAVPWLVHSFDRLRSFGRRS